MKVDRKDIVIKNGVYYLKKGSKKKRPRKKSRRAFLIDSSTINLLIKIFNKDGLIYIPYEVMSSKNSKEFIYVKGEPRLVHSKAYSAYKKKSIVYYKQQVPLFKKLFTGDLPHRMWFYYIRATRSRFDYQNMIQGPADIMKASGMIVDDDADHVKIFPGDYIVNKHFPGLIISPVDLENFSSYAGRILSLAVDASK